MIASAEWQNHTNMELTILEARYCYSCRCSMDRSTPITCGDTAICRMTATLRCHQLVSTRIRSCPVCHATVVRALPIYMIAWRNGGTMCPVQGSACFVVDDKSFLCSVLVVKTFIRASRSHKCAVEVLSRRGRAFSI